jgi:hypothetical protein
LFPTGSDIEYLPHVFVRITLDEGSNEMKNDGSQLDIIYRGRQEELPWLFLKGTSRAQMHWL